MVKRSINILIFILIEVVYIYAQSSNYERESVLDNIISITPEIIKEIPLSQKLCASIPLAKQLIDIGDCKLYVEEEGNGIPLVLINGGPGGTHHCFHPWFSKAQDYAKIIYYDQRGCGNSDFAPGVSGYSAEQATDDLDAIRKKLKIDKWVVLGFSYGGFLAQYYTTRYPENVYGLVLLGASPGLWTSPGKSRQLLFISAEEQKRIHEINLELNELFKTDKIKNEDFIKIQIFNSYLNGDWKRQHFYKPSIEKMSQIAEYEWIHDNDFNRIMNESAYMIDLTGAFNMNPIPTLILEGKWDLTWSDQKKEILKANHPNSRMEIFDNAGHSIFDEDTEKFFKILKGFLDTLKPVADPELISYQHYIDIWNSRRLIKPEFRIKTAGWGIISSKKLVLEYNRNDLENLTSPLQYLRLGFANYDMNLYEEALFIFDLISKKFESDTLNYLIALIWQGHMLDLLGERAEAIERYKIVADSKSEERIQHAQYNLTYKLSSYANDRVKSPFVRIENFNSE